ncbi:MAG: arginyltransferase [Caulobacteraceae bacterium]
MTQHFNFKTLQFFRTSASPCPYLTGQEERKVFAHLPLLDGARVNDELTQSGFRRSQGIAYRPVCEGCDACVSARIPVADYEFSRSERRILNRNTNLERHLVEAEATAEQYDLLRRYLEARHPGGGMAGMGWPDYLAMVEDTPVRTHMVEYRVKTEDGPGALAACALVDSLSDGLSLVYSFYDPEFEKSSPGSFIILDHVVQARASLSPYVYLGYWISGSPKMAYKAKFQPIEVLGGSGWRLLSAREV